MVVYIGIDGSTSTTFFSSPNIIRVKDNTKNTIDNINLEDYIIGVVASEMPASFNEEALKAQAVAARTYAMYKIDNSNKNYDVVTDVSNQGYIDLDGMKSKWGKDFDKYYNKIKMVVKETEGKVMYYDNKVIIAYYFAMSNGYTEDVKNVFNEDREYLQSVESSYDSKLKNFISNKVISKKDICNKLNIKCDKLIINNIKRSDTGRVNTIIINGITYKGTEIRKKLNLRSTDFSIKEEDNNIVFITKGYGHGVGMSQYGANGMALSGYSYEDILKYYYKNIEISTI
jgi:stage II sporulation protein D